MLSIRVIKVSSVPLLVLPFLFELTNCNANRDKSRFTVVGTAVSVKNDPAIRSNDSVFYYLEGIRDWPAEYLGRKVKVTGRLVVRNKPESGSATDSLITAIPQINYGKRNIIETPKWRLVE
jgi:hypothetical protein